MREYLKGANHFCQLKKTVQKKHKDGGSRRIHERQHLNRESSIVSPANSDGYLPVKLGLDSEEDGPTSNFFDGR
jgi:hypothetical protein